MIGALPPGVELRDVEAELHGVHDTAVVVPARDEAERIGRLVDSLAAQDGPPPLTVVVANDCTDETAAVAARALRRAALPHLVLDVAIRSGGVGAARAAGFAAVAPLVRPGAAYLSTDADCWLDPSWLVATRRHLAAADAVCGLAAGDPDELRELSIATPHHHLEDVYHGLARELALRLDPAAPRREHGQTGGASLAVRRAAYEAVGGFVPLPFGEDADLVRRLESAGYEVVFAADVKVFASCRIEGRTPRGMAATLKERCLNPDPPVAGDLEPMAAMIARLAARAECRRLMERGAPIDPLARQLGIAGPVPPFERFGPAWAFLEAASPQLAREPMRFSALPSQVAGLEQYLAATAPALTEQAAA